MHLLCLPCIFSLRLHMTDFETQTALRTRLLELEIEHRDLDDVIDNMLENVYVDQLLMTRMKKRKLQLKDQIARLRSRLIPDIDA